MDNDESSPSQRLTSNVPEAAGYLLQVVAWDARLDIYPELFLFFSMLTPLSIIENAYRSRGSRCGEETRP
jgi:hypothetical protein